MTKGPYATNYFSKREEEKSSPTSVGHLVIICLWQWPCRAGGGLLTEPSVCQTVMGAGTKQAPSQPMQAEGGRNGWFTAPILTCEHVCHLTSSPAALSKAGVESSQRHRRGLHSHAVSGREAGRGGRQQCNRPRRRGPSPGLPRLPRRPAHLQRPAPARAPAPPPGAPAAGGRTGIRGDRGNKRTRSEKGIKEGNVANTKNKRRNFPRGEERRKRHLHELFFPPTISAEILTMHVLVFPFPAHTNLLLFYFHYFTLLY